MFQTTRSNNREKYVVSFPEFLFVKSLCYSWLIVSFCAQKMIHLTIFHIRCPYCMTTRFYLFHNFQPRIFKTSLGSFLSLVTTSNKDFAGQIRKATIKFNIEGKQKKVNFRNSLIFFSLNIPTSFTSSRTQCTLGLLKTCQVNRRGDMEWRERFNKVRFTWKLVGSAGLNSDCWRTKERIRESDFCITDPLWAMSCPILHPKGGLALPADLLWLGKSSLPKQ